jgi:hypothetical protein
MGKVEFKVGKEKVEYPDEFQELFNSIGFQFRFVTMSGKNEVIAALHTMEKAYEFFKKNKHLLDDEND